MFLLGDLFRSLEPADTLFLVWLREDLSLEGLGDLLSLDLDLLADLSLESLGA